ncbi:MAG: hypothetical protein SF187_00720 [Deltaproteobacteria bacterium]|nr:hypothetical protein [Deltaproteobacteria bacterium]
MRSSSFRRALGKSVVVTAALASLPLACGKSDPTGYLLDIRSEPPEDQLPSAVSVNCFKPSGYCLKDFVYPGPGKTLSYQPGNQLLTLAMEVEDGFDKPRRLWVRARREFDTLGEYAAVLPVAQAGKQIKVDVLIKWGRLADKDRDEVPDVIDDCPDKADREQDAPCGVGEADAGAPDANAVDAAIKLDAQTTGNDAASTDALPKG